MMNKGINKIVVIEVVSNIVTSDRTIIGFIVITVFIIVTSTRRFSFAYTCIRKLYLEWLKQMMKVRYQKVMWVN